MEATTTDLQSEVARLRHELQALTADRKDEEQITVANYLLTRLEQLGVSVRPLFYRAMQLIGTPYPSPSLVYPATSICVRISLCRGHFQSDT